MQIVISSYREHSSLIMICNQSEILCNQLENFP